MTPERERELALQVAQDVVAKSGATYLPYVDWHAVAMRLPDAPEFEGLSQHDLVVPCRDIAALARTARVTIEIAATTSGSDR